MARSDKLSSSPRSRTTMDKSEPGTPRLSKDPSAESWWGLMSDLPFDESTRGGITTVTGSSPPISPTKWWEMRMDDSPSDEISQYELEAASFDEKTATASKKQAPPPPKFAEHRMFEDPYKSHTTGKELNFCQGGTAILDMLETNMCNTELIDSPAMRRMENNMTLGKLEEQIEKMNKAPSKLWKIIGRATEGYMSDDSSQSSSPPSPVASIEASFDDIDIISDLENDVAYFRRGSNSAQSVSSSSKYKTLLKTVRGLPKLNSGFFQQQEQQQHDRPLTPRNVQKNERGRSKTPRRGCTSAAPKELQQQQQQQQQRQKKALKQPKVIKPPKTTLKPRAKSRNSKSKARKSLSQKTLDTPENEVDDERILEERAKQIHDRIKIVVENREAGRTGDKATPAAAAAIKHDENIPVMVDADTADCTADDLMSNLTDERHLHLNMYNGFGGFGEGRTCVPPIFQKRFNPLKKLNSMRSGSNLSTGFPPPLRMGTESHSVETEGPMSAYYTYNYESTSHSYVAYFRRGRPAQESLRLYEHPTPESFDTQKSEVVVKIDAATVGATDCAIRRGDWWGDSSPNPLCLPIVPGVAFTGRVDHIDKYASSKSGLRRGDRVVSLVRVGANSRHLCIDCERLVKVPPDNRKENSAACLPEVYLAAFQSLHLGQKNGARYRKTSLANKSILILGGATTTGAALIEVARAAGAETIYATGRDKEFGRIGDVGGLPLSRDPRHWLSVLVGKMDIIIGLDGPYGKPQLKYEHVQTLNSSGKIVIIGGPDQGNKSSFDLDSYDGRPSSLSRKLHNYNVFDSWDDDMKLAKKDLSHLMKLLKDGLLYPKIAERIPLSKVPKAHDFLDEKQVNGFVLCEPWISGKRKPPTTHTPTKLDKPVSDSHTPGRGSGKFPAANIVV